MFVLVRVFVCGSSCFCACDDFLACVFYVLVLVFVFRLVVYVCVFVVYVRVYACDVCL